jgi:hypothetical protein
MAALPGAEGAENRVRGQISLRIASLIWRYADFERTFVSRRQELYGSMNFPLNSPSDARRWPSLYPAHFCGRQSATATWRSNISEDAWGTSPDACRRERVCWSARAGAAGAGQVGRNRSQSKPFTSGHVSGRKGRVVDSSSHCPALLMAAMLRAMHDGDRRA